MCGEGKWQKKCVGTKQFVHTLTHNSSIPWEGTVFHSYVQNFICLFSVIFRNFRLHLNTLFLVSNVYVSYTRHIRTTTFPGIILVSQNQIKRIVDNCFGLLFVFYLMCITNVASLLSFFGKGNVCVHMIENEKNTHTSDMWPMGQIRSILTFFVFIWKFISMVWQYNGYRCIYCLCVEKRNHIVTQH